MKESYITTDFRKTVAEKFPQRAKEMNSAFDKRLDELRKENTGVSKELNFHLERQILAGIAAYEVLQSEMQKDEALKTVHKYLEDHALDARGKIESLLHIPRLYRVVPALFSKMARKMFGKSAGFDAVEHQTSGGVWRIDMTKCPYNDFCTKYGHPELCTCFCDSDDISYGNMHPKLLWHRTKTLGRGGDCCDFCIKLSDK